MNEQTTVKAVTSRECPGVLNTMRFIINIVETGRDYNPTRGFSIPGVAQLIPITSTKPTIQAYPRSLPIPPPPGHINAEVCTALIPMLHISKLSRESAFVQAGRYMFDHQFTNARIKRLVFKRLQP